MPFELLHSPCGPSHLSQELSRLTLGHPTHYGCTNIVHLSVCSAILGWCRSNTLVLLFCLHVWETSPLKLIMSRRMPAGAADTAGTTGLVRQRP